MSDIFVSYSRQDKARVAPLVAALERQGWSVWWDPEIVPGEEFDALIRREIDGANAVVVVWTPSSVASRWVRGEARLGAEREVLVPVRFGQARLPIDAMAIHTTDLDDWQEDPRSKPFQELLQALMRHLKDVPRKGQGGGQPISIAVLPFVNMSSDPEQEYFSDGLSEELLNQLAQLKDLHVIARTSCFAFKGKNEDVRVIGQKLGVGHVLEGSVRKAGKRIRITAQLIKCEGHHHLWSQTYDRELDDIFAIQDDISREVAAALKVALGVGGTPQAPGGTRNAEAYDLYLRGLSLYHNPSQENFLRMAEFMRRSVALDPLFANGWLTLAEVLLIGLSFGYAADGHLASELDAALDRVMAIAPDLWEGHAARAERLMRQRQFFQAERSYAKAIELGPRAFPGFNVYTSLIGIAGRIDESLPYFYRVREADPLQPMATLQMFLVCARRYTDAHAEYVRAKETATGPLMLPEWFSFSQALATQDHAEVKARLAGMIVNSPSPLALNQELLDVFDDPDGAIAWIRQKLMNPSPEMRGRTILFAFLAAYFGAPEYALELQRRYFLGTEQTATMVNIWHPVFAATRKLAGFKDLVRDLGIYDYWRQSGKWGDFAQAKGDDDFEIVK
jgi:adenylate cyclase